MQRRLHEFLLVRRAEIIRTWTEAIHQTLAPNPLSKVELIDHLPGFLDEVTAHLKQNAVGAVEPPETPTAAEHGLQRLRLGFDLEGLVREYGMLRRTIVSLARREETTFEAEDYDVLFECLISGIADAVTQYTEEREAERQRQSSEHFAFIAHEIRNPLSTALLALTSLRAKGMLQPSRQTEMLERGLQRMHALIEHSLGLAFIGAGVQLHKEDLALETLLVEAATEAMVEAEEKGVRLEIQAGGDERLHVDHRLVLSALNNLVRNAVKFTHPGTVVHVRWVRVGTLLRIEVEDACGGLPPNKTEELFTPFVQGGADRSGFGLGLAIVRQAIEAHGGSVHARDLPGKGCVFVLELPVG